jgi:starch synthase
MPSVREGLGMAVIEAQAFGVPVVVSDAGGLPEVVIDNLTGLIVPLSAYEAGVQVNPSDLAAAVLRLMGDHELAQSVSRAARTAYEERFTSDVMVGAYERLYRDCLEHAEKRGRPSSTRE